MRSREEILAFCSEAAARGDAAGGPAVMTAILEVLLDIRDHVSRKAIINLNPAETSPDLFEHAKEVLGEQGYIVTSLDGIEAVG